MREAREEVCEEVEVVCSVRMVVRWAMQELEGRGLAGMVEGWERAERCCLLEEGGCWGRG